ncbi:MAG: enhanced serine sensitivity protein SseB [Coriobacteriia bacterium]|nr:enhanced serine sensitivity protein SseB [Coriobacteriia bacterium]
MIDVNQPLENPELVAAISTVNNEPNQKNELALVDLLVEAHFLLPISDVGGLPSANDQGEIVLESDTKVSFVLIADASSRQWLAGFTDWQALRAWRVNPEEKTWVMPFDDVTAMVLDNAALQGFVLNYGSETLYFTKEQITHLKARKSMLMQESSSEAPQGAPGEKPSELVVAVSTVLMGIPEVSRAWLTLMQTKEGPSFVIVLDTASMDRSVFDKVGNTAARFLPAGIFLDIIPYSERFAADAVAGKKPFYVKQ